MKIVLLGLKGVGKTTCGKKLAKKMGLDFFDGDEEIHKRFGRSPQKIYKKDGEEKLRFIELQFLQSMQAENNYVLAVGGGTYLSLENQKVLKKLGVLICLHLKKEQLLLRWGKWPLVCKSYSEYELYYQRRIEKLRELSCVWVDGLRGDLVDIIERVCDGK